MSGCFVLHHRLSVESCALSVECSLPPSPPPPFSFLLSHLVCTPSVGRMAVLLGRPSHRRITIRRHRHQQNGYAPAGLSTHGECGILNQILKKGREVFRDTTVGGGIHDGGTYRGVRRVRRGDAAADSHRPFAAPPGPVTSLSLAVLLAPPRPLRPRTL